MVESLLDTVLCIINLTPMIPLCNGFYLFPLSRAVNSNSLIFDPSEFKIGLFFIVASLEDLLYHYVILYYNTE